jgi:hypothetical protein
MFDQRDELIGPIAEQRYYNYYHYYYFDWGKGPANPVAQHSQQAKQVCSPVSQVRCIGKQKSPTSQPSMSEAFNFMGMPLTHQSIP